MPFEVLEVTDDGHPLICCEFRAEHGPWPGDPAMWKRVKPGLLNFLETMRLPTVVSCVSHGLHGAQLYRDDAMGPFVLSARAYLTFSGDLPGAVQVSGVVGMPISVPALIETSFRDGLEEAGLPDPSEHEGFISAATEQLSERLGHFRWNEALAPLGYRADCTVGPSDTFGFVLPSLPLAMIRLAGVVCQYRNFVSLWARRELENHSTRRRELHDLAANYVGEEEHDDAPR